MMAKPNHQHSSFPRDRTELETPIITALRKLGGMASRKQIVCQLIEDLMSPPYTDNNYWEGQEPAVQEYVRRRRPLFEQRTSSALQLLRDDGRVVLQGRSWHLRS